MLELPHTVVGAVIAAKIGNPALALPLSLASHFALDLVPHWNPHLNAEMKRFGKVTRRTTLFIAGDVTLSLAAGFLIASGFLPNYDKVSFVLAGALMGVLPDLVESPHFFFNQHWGPIEKLVKFQKSIQNDAPPIWGVATQLLLLVASFVWLYS